MNLPVGIGYITLPSDIDRDRYIALSLRSCTVSIRTNDGAYYNDVPVSFPVLDYIQFPSTIEELGSPVVYINDTIRDRIIIVGILPQQGDLQDRREDDFKVQKSYQNTVIEISGNPKSGHISLNIQSDKTAQINLNVTSTKDAAINVNVNGKVNINSKSFQLNEGSEKMVKGDTLKKLLDQIISSVSDITVITSLGQMPILNKLAVEKLKQETEKILTDKATLD